MDTAQRRHRKDTYPHTPTHPHAIVVVVASLVRFARHPTSMWKRMMLQETRKRQTHGKNQSHTYLAPAFGDPSQWKERELPFGATRVKTHNKQTGNSRARRGFLEKLGRWNGFMLYVPHFWHCLLIETLERGRFRVHRRVAHTHTHCQCLATQQATERDLAVTPPWPRIGFSDVGFSPLLAFVNWSHYAAQIRSHRIAISGYDCLSRSLAFAERTRSGTTIWTKPSWRTLPDERCAFMWFLIHSFHPFLLIMELDLRRNLLGWRMRG